MNGTQRNNIKIEDEIALLGVSRQRKYQLRKMRDGLCIICGGETFRDTLFCIEHNLKRGIRQPGKNRKSSKMKFFFRVLYNQ